MTKRKVIRESNRLFTYNPNYYNWGGDFKESLKGLGPFDLKSTFSGTNVANMLKGGLASGLGSTLGNIGGNLISGGLESSVGNTFSNIGGTVGKAISAVNPVLGGLMSAGSGIIGGGINAVLGSKLNQEKINEIEGSNERMNTLVVDNSNTDTIENQWANQNFDVDFTQSDIGKDGLFSNKAKNKYKELKLQQDIARNRAFASYKNAINSADFNLDLNLLLNYAAYGGLLDMNNQYSDGGKIYIKPENRGKFTALKERTGKSATWFKEHGTPAQKKMATFALNAAKWKHKDGGPLSTHGLDLSNGVVLVNNGNTHENNKYEGVLMGIDNQGIPNLVEEGEVVFNDYVFSNRLKVPDAVKNKYKLRGNKELTFADAAKQMLKESEERPNDPISKKGLTSSMSILQLAQEDVRLKKQASQKGVQYAHGGRMGTLFDGKGPFYNGFTPSYEDWVASELVPDTPVLGVDWHPTGKINYTKGETSPNYQVREVSVPTTFWGALDKKSEEQNKYVHRVPVKKNKINTNTDDIAPSWLRYAPAFGSALGVGYNLLSKPDYSRANALEQYAQNAGKVTPISYEPIGNYLTYRPTDLSYQANRMAALAGATRRNIMNTSGGNRASAIGSLLAADYNSQIAMGEAIRQAEATNFARRAQVEEFNRGTNLYNSEAALKAAIANQQARLDASRLGLSGYTTAMQMKDAIDAQRARTLSANLTNLFESLGQIGEEQYDKNRLKWLERKGVLRSDYFDTGKYGRV